MINSQAKKWFTNQRELTNEIDVELLCKTKSAFDVNLYGWSDCPINSSKKPWIRQELPSNFIEDRFNNTLNIQTWWKGQENISLSNID